MVDYDGNIIPDEHGNTIYSIWDRKKLDAYRIRCEADPEDPNGDNAPRAAPPPPIPIKAIEPKNDIPKNELDFFDPNIKVTPPPSADDDDIESGVIKSDYLKDKDYRVKQMHYFGYCRPMPLKERVSASRVLKLWKLIYPDYEVVRLGGYKSNRGCHFYAEYMVVEKSTQKIIIEKATINALLVGVRDEYYDYKNY